ncbi:hypothetical protein [Sphingopyxis flava]|uniref:Uncharacterized protein n=1 Tax=Sphingopyxis flava TaxID=1507287 RepID=A0A1T5CTJ6_9SPHN|nr:hypothetical protein [Sphingopyxis flava]SKB62641.1 hypothetical protein SAMN06295937_101192 [Sphingopyxis flava]
MTTYPFKELTTPGDSFPFPPEKYASVRSAASQYAKRHGVRLKIHQGRVYLRHPQEVVAPAPQATPLPPFSLHDTLDETLRSLTRPGDAISIHCPHYPTMWRRLTRACQRLLPNRHFNFRKVRGEPVIVITRTA